MLARISRYAFVFSVFALLAVCAHANTILGDTTAIKSFSFTPAQYGNGSFMCYEIVGEPSQGGWKVNGHTDLTGTAPIPYSGGTVSFSIHTSGIGITPATGSTTQYISFSVYPAGVPGATCLHSEDDYFLVDPAISLNKTYVPLTPPSTSSQQQITATISPILAINVTATCQAQNGPQFSVSTPVTEPVDQGTGRAIFFINVSDLVLINPSGTPSASCTFEPSTDTAGGTPNSATLTFQTKSLDPILTLNPTSISTNGTTNVSATMSNTAYSGLTIDGSCSQSTLPAGSSISMPSSMQTGALGQAIFPVLATNLIFIDPNFSGPLPTPSCAFHFENGTRTSTLMFTTHNACDTSYGLMPKPAGCGNPAP